MSDFSRRFNLKNRGYVVARISHPMRSASSGDDWECKYQILGMGNEKEKVAVGADSIQSIYLALQYVATTLYFSQEFETGELSWEGGMTSSDLGLPIVETAREEIERKKTRVEAINLRVKSE